MMLEMPTAEPLQAAADEPGTGEELPPAPKIEFNVQAEPSLAGNSIAAGMQGSVKQPMDDDLEKEMPYLYSERKDRMNPAESIAFAQPLGDAVVPGGAFQSPDMETMKKYLLLREQDVAALSSLLKTARQRIADLEFSLRQSESKNAGLQHSLDASERRITGFENEKQLATDAFQTEISDLKFQLKTKTDKAKLLEARVREAAEETEKIRERVKADIRKIRVRERELENRLEILRKDSEALIGARESKIIELKRKLDMIEFNMDLLQDQYNKEKERAATLKERLGKASQAMRVAGGFLESGEDAKEEQAAS